MNTPREADEYQKNPNQLRKKKVIILNDNLRTTAQGGHIVVTGGVSLLPMDIQIEISTAIQNTSEFPPDKDHYEEHDFGIVEVQGIKVIWKIDYYDHSMKLHSPDKSDPTVTNRVMTIMLESEY